MNIKLVSRYIGIALLFNALFMLFSVLVSALNGFDASFSPLLISLLITVTIGLFPLIFVRKSEDVNLRDGFAVTLLSWILSCFFGMLPYVLWGGEFTLINAWFESVSGYTTMGGTILTNIEALPRGLLFWRSSTHFIGGIGVVIFMLLVLPTMSTFRLRMSKLEISSLSKENYKFKTRETVAIISTVYVGIAVLATIFLMLAGMDLFDAVNHAFSIVATGGFSTKNLSIMAYDSFPIELVSMVFMLLSGLHFGLLYSSIVGRSFKVLKSPIIKFFLIFILVSSLAMTIDIKVSGNVDTWEMALRQGFFQAISIGTCTGLATADTSIWPVFSILMLLYLSVQGACSGSTTGGLKVDRVWIFIKSIITQIKKQMHPNAVIPIKVGSSVIDNETASGVSLHIAFYIFILFIATLILSLTGLDFMDAVSSTIASMGNVGPGYGADCGSLGNFDHFPYFAKFLLTILMLLGRLEIYTLLMVFAIYKRR